MTEIPLKATKLNPKYWEKKYKNERKAFTKLNDMNAQLQVENYSLKKGPLKDGLYVLKVETAGLEDFEITKKLEKWAKEFSSFLEKAGYENTSCLAVPNDIGIVEIHEFVRILKDFISEGNLPYSIKHTKEKELSEKYTYEMPTIFRLDEEVADLTAKLKEKDMEIDDLKKGIK